MQNFGDLFSQYRTLIAVVTLAIIGLAVPITLNLVGQQQDLQQRASQDLDAYQDCVAACNTQECRESCMSILNGTSNDRCLEKVCSDGSAPLDYDANCNPICDDSNSTDARCTSPNKDKGCGCSSDSECASGYCNKIAGVNICDTNPNNGSTDPGSGSQDPSDPDAGNQDPGTGSGNAGSSPVGGTRCSVTVRGEFWLDANQDGRRDALRDKDQVISAATVAAYKNGQKVTETRTTLNTNTYQLLLTQDGSYDIYFYSTRYKPTSRHPVRVNAGCETRHTVDFGVTQGASDPLPRLQPTPTSIRTAPTSTPTTTTSGNACGTSCRSNSVCAGASDGCTVCDISTSSGGDIPSGRCVKPITPTASASSCGSSCSDNSACAGADGCTVCESSRGSDNGTGRCVQPISTSPTPTPTSSANACGKSCRSNNSCANAQDGCTECKGWNVGDYILFGQCSAPSSPSPTTSPVPSPTGTQTCGSTCQTNTTCQAGTDGCSICADNNQGGKSCQRQGPTPSPTIGSQDGAVRANVRMPGIGQNTGDNPNPQNPHRTAQIIVFNTNNQQVANGSGTLTYSSGVYSGLINLGSQIQSGTYYATIGFDNTLDSRIPGVFQVTKGQETTLTTITLIPGDVDQNNVLDIKDYNIFLNCFGSKQCSAKSLSDFNDNGSVEAVDYNILLRSFAIRRGD